MDNFIHTFNNLSILGLLFLNLISGSTYPMKMNLFKRSNSFKKPIEDLIETKNPLTQAIETVVPLLNQQNKALSKKDDQKLVTAYRVIYQHYVEENKPSRTMELMLIEAIDNRIAEFITENLIKISEMSMENILAQLFQNKLPEELLNKYITNTNQEYQKLLAPILHRAYSHLTELEEWYKKIGPAAKVLNMNAESKKIVINYQQALKKPKFLLIKKDLSQLHYADLPENIKHEPSVTTLVSICVVKRMLKLKKKSMKFNNKDKEYLNRLLHGCLAKSINLSSFFTEIVANTVNENFFLSLDELITKKSKPNQDTNTLKSEKEKIKNAFSNECPAHQIQYFKLSTTQEKIASLQKLIKT